MTHILPSAIPLDRAARTTVDSSVLRTHAKALESAFLSEMLGFAGLGKPRDGFGGGIGEEQFASFLRQEQASAMVAKGGIGLAESLFQALSRADHANR